MSEFLAMGGYAWYIWMAYGGAALAIAVEIANLRARRKRVFDELRMSVDPTPRSPSMQDAGGNR
jgi:heme exporter protein D